MHGLHDVEGVEGDLVVGAVLPAAADGHRHVGDADAARAVAIGMGALVFDPVVHAAAGDADRAAGAVGIGDLDRTLGAVELDVGHRLPTFDVEAGGEGDHRARDEFED